ncbi:bifunctional diaminohydroxyphosphoribosylaminopyrimidine deaminase/5-amino-6-(5-phosphoribosylamino)uracil reductase RibD [Zhongshania aliphaticivorans]|uniref:bifunctional diaminohydroxyphosphoribosylaminopyrimidine deaminase/5-amino-6-(5-phosphoribosylamino)uracil reductase RibD n=1 Tax=Zhongshania aliphaticivorans TaxID=1470434 RepID=UPI0012E5E7BC|nr:bifunctional diaminohydroxyphosphoribosylaminopyrimidine deaminase/5-amino-6-(5-phosphoribosylamino)uracil reductase RibD [Zhongshania aliphaticivorans]CAA0091163.1 Riboflavin biosynthesis protein RibD [Zhongshania aliphaticivorans]
MSFTDVDRQMMAQALRLAEHGRYSTSPNPRVGCVICRDDQIVSQGWHQRAGEGHAEVKALEQLSDARAATAYVTLEPCSHQGRTPPCADTLINAGVSRVVVAVEDPNPLVAGRGITRLREAGIQVDVGLMAAQAEALNIGFMRRMRGGLPWLRLKSASSIDGRTAMASGESQWITGPAARADVQKLRAQSCAILSGVETILHDDAALTVRGESFSADDPSASVLDGHWRQPLRLIVDSALRTPVGATLFKAGGEVVIATRVTNSKHHQALIAAGATVVVLEDDGHGKVSLPAVMQYLADRSCNEVLLEAGAILAGAALRAGLVDEWFVYMAPCLMGSSGRPLINWPMAAMSEQQAVDIVDIRAVGKDWRIQCRVPKRDGSVVEQS